MKKITLSLASLLLSATAISTIAFADQDAQNKENKSDVPRIRTIVSKKDGDNYVQLMPNVEYTKVGKSLKMESINTTRYKRTTDASYCLYSGKWMGMENASGYIRFYATTDPIC